MGNWCSKDEGTPVDGNNGEAARHITQPENEPKQSEELVINTQSSRNSCESATVSPSTTASQREQLKPAGTSKSLEGIPFIDESDVKRPIEDLVTAGTSIQITAQYGGAVQMGEDSIVIVEDADRFTQGPMSNVKTDVNPTPRGLVVNAVGQGGPGIVQLGSRSKICYPAPRTKPKTGQTRLPRDQRPTKPVNGLVAVFNGFTTRPRGEMRKPIDNTQSMEYMETLVGFSQSVGKICIHAYPPCTGTGFRVGKRYVMTAYHVVQAHIPDKETLFYNNPDIYIDFTNKSTSQNGLARYQFNSLVYENPELDVIVLELSIGEGSMLPPEVKFCDVFKDQPFTFVGYDRDKDKGSDPACYVVEPTEDEITRGIMFCHENGFSCDQTYQGLRNPNFVRFNCTFEKGASGSPGVAVCGNEARVCIMLLKGYPEFYWNLPPTQQQRFRNENLLEEGICMERVKLDMMGKNSNLYTEVFSQ